MCQAWVGSACLKAADQTHLNQALCVFMQPGATAASHLGARGSHVYVQTINALVGAQCLQVSRQRKRGCRTIDVQAFNAGYVVDGCWYCQTEPRLAPCRCLCSHRLPSSKQEVSKNLSEHLAYTSSITLACKGY